MTKCEINGRNGKAKTYKNLSKMTRDEKTSLARIRVWIKLRHTDESAHTGQLDCQRRHSQASKVPGVVDGRFLSRNILILLEA